MRLAMVLMAAALAAQAQPGSVEGKVVNDTTGQPVSKATVLLHGPMGALFYTSTDEKGRYAFGGIEPGAYTVTAERAGFVTAKYGARRLQDPAKTVMLAAAGRAAGIDLRLMPAGAISGRVTFADGEPAFGASLSLMRAQYVDGRKELVELSASTRVQSGVILPTANDLGEFHISSLEPGRYYLCANSNRSGGWLSNMGNVRTAAPVMDVLRTCFPSAVEMRNAQLIEVRSGRATTDVSITLAEMPMGTIRGRLENSSAVSGKTVNLILFGQNGQVFFVRQDPQTGELEAQGAIPLGRYTAAVLIGGGPGGRNSGSVRYDLIPVDVNGSALTAALHPAVALSGMVRVEEGGARVDVRQIRVVLRPAGYVPVMPEFLKPMAPVAVDGRFTFSEISANRYAVQLTGLPEGVYVQSIRAGDVDVLEKGLDLTSAGQVQIVLSRKAGSVEGSVTDAQGKALEGATVALVPVKGREYRTAVTDENGKFTVKAAPPGEYRAFAWQEVEDGAWTDAEFLKPVMEKGKMVTVEEGSGAKVELKAIGVR